MRSLIKCVVLCSFLMLVPRLSAQAWSGIINATRATDWSIAGIAGGIPTSNTICQTMTSADTSATINAAIAACPPNQVVFLSAGTYTLNAGLIFNGVSNVRVRGAGPNNTILNFTGNVSCNGPTADICIKPSTALYNGSAATQPGGSQACSWTAGFSQGTTSITLGSCGGAPPNGGLLVLDQANDTTDNSGLIECDTVGVCRQNGSGNFDGRIIGGIDYSATQVVTITSVSGTGPYTVGISPGLKMNNWRIGQTPGAWWPNNVVNDGIEKVTVDHTNGGASVGINYTNCLSCWFQNIRSIKGGSRDHVQLNITGHFVGRDSYFFENQNHASSSYGIEPEIDSDHLVENNIFQKVTSPIIYGVGQGNVDAYNYTINNPWTSPPTFMQISYSSHNAGTGMNLWEGNSMNAIGCDNVWGTAAVVTYFRNRLHGWQSGATQETIAVDIDLQCRGFNVIGNVLGEPAYHTVYETFAPSNGTNCFLSVYSLGWAGGPCSNGGDTITRSTLMRWGNYDIVSAAVRWDNTESSPGAVAFIGAQSTPGSHTLPASFYLAAKPSWWNTEPYPPIGPDVTGGSGPGGFSYNIPAQDCALNVMSMPADGSGNVLAFDATLCPGSSGGGGTSGTPGPSRGLP